MTTFSRLAFLGAATIGSGGSHFGLALFDLVGGAATILVRGDQQTIRGDPLVISIRPADEVNVKLDCGASASDNKMM